MLDLFIVRELQFGSGRTDVDFNSPVPLFSALDAGDGAAFARKFLVTDTDLNDVGFFTELVRKCRLGAS